MESRTLLSILVDTFDDVVSVTDGVTSLREAIAQAAGDPGADTIIVPRSIGGVEGTYALSLGELAIDDAGPLTIQSQDGPATLDAQGASRVFSVAAGSDVTLEGLVITGGYSPDSGGGILNQGTLTIQDSTIQGNATEFDGGGISNSGTLTVDNCGVLDNSSFGNGGGVSSSLGTAIFTACTISGNEASYGSGGGLDNESGTANISDSTISGNSAAYAGGGLYNGYSGTVNLARVSIDDNICLSRLGRRPGQRVWHGDDGGLLADRQHGHLHGGGIYSFLGSVTITDSHRRRQLGSLCRRSVTSPDTTDT